MSKSYQCTQIKSQPKVSLEGITIRRGNLDIADTISDYQKARVATKARHIIDALRILNRSVNNNYATAWKNACIKVCTENYRNVSWRKIIIWYRDLHTTIDGDLCFTKFEKGLISVAPISPFLEDKSLLLQFKIWARMDLEYLKINKATEWANMRMLSGW